MNSDESFLTIRIFYKEKSFDINSKDIITLKEIKEKSIKHFNISALYKNKNKFIVKDNENDNDDNIYISSEDDIIKNSIVKDPQNLIIELQLTTDDIRRTKTKLLDKDKEKNNKSIIDNNRNCRKEKNTFIIIYNDRICFEGNMMKIKELYSEIQKYKEYYLKSSIEMQKLENYKKEICMLKEVNLKLLIKEEKVIEINIQSSLEKFNINKQKLHSINNDIPRAKEEESSSIIRNNGNSNNNNKDDLNQVISIDKEILEKQENLKDNLSNINLGEIISNNYKKNKYLSRNEEIKREIDISNLNPKTEIKKIKGKNKFNFEEKKLDIDIINKIRKQCGDQVKSYSDEKIQRILDDNGGNFKKTLVDIMLRFSKIINN